MLLYIRVLNQLPYRESNSDRPDSTGEVDRNTLARHHQKQMRDLQRTKENYYLERCSFF
jgi:hypothetical protein